MRSSGLPRDLFSAKASVKRAQGFNVFQEELRADADLEAAFFDSGRDSNWKNKTVEVPPRKEARPKLFQLSMGAEKLRCEGLPRPRRREASFAEGLHSLPIKRPAKGSLTRVPDPRVAETGGGGVGLGKAHGQLHELRAELGRV